MVGTPPSTGSGGNRVKSISLCSMARSKKRLFIDRARGRGTVVLQSSRSGDQAEEFIYFARAFAQCAREAAKSLRRRKTFGLHGIPMDDFLVYPVVFLYRHALELHIKAILLAAGLENEKLQGHSLQVLGTKLEQVFSDYGLTWNFRIPRFRSLKDFRDFTKELQNVDEKSSAFRYPIDTKGRPSLEASFRFNLFEFCEPLDALLPKLDGSLSVLEAALEARADAAYYAE